MSRELKSRTKELKEENYRQFLKNPELSTGLSNHKHHGNHSEHLRSGPPFDFEFCGLPFPRQGSPEPPNPVEQIPVIECCSLGIHILIDDSNRIYGGKKKRPDCLEFKKKYCFKKQSSTLRAVTQKAKATGDKKV